MGPTAQDFYAAFGLDNDERPIGTMDTDGVAPVAIQGPYAKNQEQDAYITGLKAQNADLESRLAAALYGYSP